MKTKKTPTAFLGAVMIITLLEGAMMPQLKPYFSNPATILMGTKNAFVQNSSANPDIIFLGDSTATASVDVQEFEKQTSLSAYNLGLFDDAGMAGIYFTLHDYLKHHKKPRAVVLMNHHAFWPQVFEGQTEKALVTFFNNTSHFLNLRRHGFHQPTLLLKFLIHKLFLSYSHRHELSRMINNILHDRPLAELKKWHSEIRDRITQKKGQLLWVENDPRNMDEIFRIHLESLAHLSFHVSDINRIYLNEFLTLTRAENIPVLFQLPPIALRIIADGPAQKFLGDYLKFLLQLKRRYSHFKLASLTYNAYPEEVFTGNIHHLDEATAKNFTQKISTDIFLLIENQSDSLYER